MAQMYTELDYAHPFSDGNGRSLRVFTRHLANETGYTIRLETFALNNEGRDLLYIAHDKSVNQLARPHLQHEHSLRKIIQTEARMANSRDLQLRDLVRPLRSLAFERLTQTQALQVHPELTAAYQTLSRADQQFEASAPKSPQARRTVLDRVKAQIQKRLNDGETYHFTGPEQALLARTTVGHPHQLQPVRDRRAWEGARLRQTLQRKSGRAVAAKYVNGEWTKRDRYPRIAGKVRVVPTCVASNGPKTLAASRAPIRTGLSGYWQKYAKEGL